MSIRVICRAIVLDPDTGKVLLVRNRGQKFWYPPGGGWEEAERIRDCVRREVFEEVGIRVEPVRLLYVQEFAPNKDEKNLEMFWLAHPTGETVLDAGHVDVGGIVEERGWFNRAEVANMDVFPRKLRDQFWAEVGTLLSTADPFISK